MKPDRAWVLLPSGRRLNLVEPDPWAWTDRDLAIGLSRTYRWAGYSAVSARSAACRNPGGNLRDLCPLEWPSDTPAGGDFGGSRDHCAG